MKEKGQEDSLPLANDTIITGDNRPIFLNNSQLDTSKTQQRMVQSHNSPVRTPTGIE